MIEEYRKQLRSKLTDHLLDFLRRSGLPDKMLGFLLRTAHFHTPWYFLLFFIFLPKRWALAALVPLVLSALLFFYFKGCFLSVVEYKLTGRDDNIIDPYILLCNETISDSSRYSYTVYTAVIYFIVAFLILLSRGCFSL